MSHVKFKRWQCHMSLCFLKISHCLSPRLMSPLLKSLFKKNVCIALLNLRVLGHTLHCVGDRGSQTHQILTIGSSHSQRPGSQLTPSVYKSPIKQSYFNLEQYPHPHPPILLSCFPLRQDCFSQKGSHLQRLFGLDCDLNMAVSLCFQPNLKLPHSINVIDFILKILEE